MKLYKIPLAGLPTLATGGNPLTVWHLSLKRFKFVSSPDIPALDSEASKAKITKLLHIQNFITSYSTTTILSNSEGGGVGILIVCL